MSMRGLCVVIFCLIAARAQGAELRLLVPEWLQSEAGLNEIADEFRNRTGSNLTTIAVPSDVPSDLIIHQQLPNSPIDLVFGWSASSPLMSKLEQGYPRFVPNWINGSDNIFTTLDNPQGGRFTVLGAGWKFGSPKSRLIISQPIGFRPYELPLIVARPVDTRDSDSDIQKLTEAFFKILTDTSSGRNFVEGITGLPALKNASSLGVEWRLRPHAEDDDGCGCDSASATCNPDGFVATAFSLDAIRGNRFVAHALRAHNSDDDGCNCDDNSTLRIESFVNDGRFEKEEGKISSRRLSDWKVHFEALERERANGNVVVVQTCNPD